MVIEGTFITPDGKPGARNNPLKIQDAEELLRKIQKRYNKNPDQDWRILMGRDSSGRPTQLIGNSKASWQIKGEMVKPSKFAGVGSRLKGVSGDDLLDVGDPFYGLRPVKKEAMRNMLKTGSKKSLKNLIGLPPASLDSVSSAEALLEGPILHSRTPITPISDKQRELENSLNRSLEKLMRDRYPETRSAYG